MHTGTEEYCLFRVEVVGDRAVAFEEFARIKKKRFLGDTCLVLYFLFDSFDADRGNAVKRDCLAIVHFDKNLNEGRLCTIRFAGITMRC